MESLKDDKYRMYGDRSKIHLFLLFLIFITAFIVRIVGVGRNPANFHDTRQFHSALLIRSYFLNTDEYKDDIARLPSVMFQRSKEQFDPRISEKIAYQMYRIFGKEDVLIPRILSVLYWLVGGLILYKIAFLIFGGTGAVVTVVFYLFFPFGINLSQSIQPESLINLFFLWGILQIIKNFRSDKGDYFYSAAMLSGFAVYLKITVIFPLIGLLIFLGINKFGLKKYLFNRKTIWFYTIMLSIGTSFYLYNIIWNKSMQGLLASMVSPELILTSGFWIGWLTQIAKVTGIVPFVIGIILFFTINRREVKFILGGLLLGYFFYAIIFSYPAMTHDYYQFVLFSIIALMLGQVGYLVDTGKSGRFGKSVLVFLILIGGVMFSLYHQNKFVKGDHKLNMYSPAFFLVGEQGSYFTNNIPENNIWGNSFAAGEAIGHGINNVLLSRTYGNAAMYYGKFFGKAWPTEEDFDFCRLHGREPLPPDKLYYSRFAPQHPKYFIITDMESWDKQSGLKKFLTENFKLFRKETGFIIFDLRSKI